jgi:hypothetical protein
MSASGSPTFAWHAVGGAEAYQIQVDDDADFSSPKRDETTIGTDYIPAAGLGGGTYYWRARAASSSEVGAWCARWGFTIPTSPLPEFKIYLPVVAGEYRRLLERR